MNHSMTRSRWAAIGAAVAVTLGGGALSITHATEPAGAVAYVPITPCRLPHSRPAPDNVGNRNTPIGSGQTHTVSAHGNNGNCVGIPATATGLQLNVTALNALLPTFLTIWPTGVAKPFTANLNPTPGEPPTPNAVTTGISAGGQFDIFNFSGTVDVVVDVMGYYTNHSHTGADIVDNSLTAVDIQNEPGVTEAFNKTLTTLDATAKTAASVAIRVPSDGFIDVHATGVWTNNGAAVSDTARCQLQKGDAVTVDTDAPWILLDDRNAAAAAYTSFALHRTMPISVADNPLLFGFGQILRLVCTETAGNILLDEVEITATFYPTEYEPTGFIFIPIFGDGASGADVGDVPAEGGEPLPTP